MLTTDIRQIAKDFEMVEYEKDFIYRNLNGYIVSAFAEDRERMLIISAVMSDEEKERLMPVIEKKITELDENKKILSYTYKDNEFAFRFGFKADIYYYMGNFMTAFTKFLSEEKVHGIAYCSVCGETLKEGERCVVNVNSSAHAMHIECAKELIEKYKDVPQARNRITPSVGKGIFAAIFGAVITSFVWGMLQGFNLFPFIAAGAIGYVMKKFYDISAGKPGVTKMVLITLGNVFAIALGYIEGFTTRYVISVKNGLAVKASFGEILSKIPASIPENKLWLALGFLISVIVCYDVYIYLGNRSTYKEEFKPYAKNIRRF